METVTLIRQEFEELKDLRQTINSLFISLSSKIDLLQEMYVDYVERSNSKESNFGIDSLHFQRRYLVEEHNGMKRMFALIGNQIYRDYYKMHKVVSTYVDKNVLDNKVKSACNPRRTYTTYKDLEPYKEYDFKEIIELHQDLTHVIVEILTFVNTREREWKTDQGKASHGLNIDNFVTTEKYQNQLMSHKANMFIEYLQVFHRFHLRYLSRFSMKLRLMYAQIQKDIKIEDATNSALSRQKSDAEHLAALTHAESIENDLTNIELSVSELNKSPLAQKEYEDFMKDLSSNISSNDTDNESLEGNMLESYSTTPTLNYSQNDKVSDDNLPNESHGNKLTEEQIKWQRNNLERKERRKKKIESNLNNEKNLETLEL